MYIGLPIELSFVVLTVVVFSSLKTKCIESMPSCFAVPAGAFVLGKEGVNIFNQYPPVSQFN